MLAQNGIEMGHNPDCANFQFGINLFQIPALVTTIWRTTASPITIIDSSYAEGSQQAWNYAAIGQYLQQWSTSVWRLGADCHCRHGAVESYVRRLFCHQCFARDHVESISRTCPRYPRGLRADVAMLLG